ncbi:hypothetical protein ACFE04_013648 [Oxalis oulophora]
MSNNVVSHPLMIPCSEIGQLETVCGSLESTMQTGSGVGDFCHQQIPDPNNQIGSFGYGSSNFGTEQLTFPHIQTSQSENVGFHDLLMPTMDMGLRVNQKFNVTGQHTMLTDHQPLQMMNMSNNVGSQQLSVLNKRKAPIESSMANKRTVQMENRPWLQQASPSQRTGQMQPAQAGPQPVLKKKVMRTESILQKPVPVQKSKKAQTLPSPKGRTDLTDSVRSKMREQLAAALDLVSQQQDNPQTKDGADVADNRQKGSDGQGTFISPFSTEFPKFDGLEYQSSIPAEDVPFNESLFARDELLQGNGLSWVLESDQDEIQTAGKQEDKKQQQFESTKVLAWKIEFELFKLFGSVNKKYKEKGRSLLFNLKDRNNPELRERVMSGELTPDRLCAMSAEELASKELSQWRQAKAEEYASMIVLPGVDMKRLVRKTHKGEFVVELEQDDNPSEDVSVGATSIILKEKETKSKKGGNEAPEGNGVMTIPSNDGGDANQEELMVDDGLNNLPPIVSLDEFMDSLVTEPPFVNLPASPITNNVELEDVPQTQSPDVGPKNPIDITIKDNSSTPVKDSNTEDSKSVSPTKPTESPAKVETSPSIVITRSELVWEGTLKLNVSSLVSVTGIFKSGEKTSAEEWPGMIEIKGRVRLDAFQKFLKELPMSRSRAIMVVHFCCQDSTTEKEREKMDEVAASYISDGRVGFAEAVHGVELYFCSPHSNPLEMLCKILPKDQVDSLNVIDNGLIGVIVWRKPLSSPKKHGYKRQHSSSRRRQDKTNINSIPEKSRPRRIPSPEPEANNDDDDLPPGFGPGVAVSRGEDDDLPEFNFSGGGFAGKLPPPPPHFPNQNISSSRPTSRPMDSVRELIQKYGKSDNDSSPRNWQDNRRNGISAWNVDDDDDIPEWQPSAPVHGVARGQLVNQFPGQQANIHMHHHQQQPPPPPVNVMQGHQQRPPWGPHGGSHGGQFYDPPPGLGGAGMPPWHQDAPRSRGF